MRRRAPTAGKVGAADSAPGSVSPSVSTCPGLAARLVVHVRRQDQRLGLTGQLLAQLTACAGRSSESVDRCEPATTNRCPATTHRATAAPRMSRPGVSGRRRHHDSLHRHPHVDQDQVAQRGKAADRVHQPEPPGQFGAALPPAKAPGRLLQHQHIGLQLPHHLYQARRDRPADRGRCRRRLEPSPPSPPPVCHDARHRRHRHRARSAAPTTPAVLANRAARTGATGSRPRAASAWW